MQATKGYFAGTHPTRTGKSKSPSGMDQKTGHTIHGGVVVVSLPKSGEEGLHQKKRKEKSDELKPELLAKPAHSGATEEGRKRAQEATIASTSGRLNHPAGQSVQALKRTRSSVSFLPIHSLTRRAALHEQQLYVVSRRGV